jgi:glycosyltransferase involved in cell wall biosynthesis
MKTRTASIIICTRDRAASLRETLNSLAAVTVPADVECELLVVDNGSRDDTARVVRDATAGDMALRYLLEPTPGQAFARNLGLREARGDVIVFTDDDVRPSPEWLTWMLEPYRDPRVSAVQGGIELAFEQAPPVWLNGAHRAWLAERAQPEAVFPYTSHLVGANLSFRSRVVAAVGPFNTLLGPGRSGFWDDSEFSARVMGAGFEQYYEPRARVRHMIPAARLRPEYFRTVAFRSGVSGFLATGGTMAGATANPYWQIARSGLRRARWEVRQRLRGDRPVSCADDIAFYLELGSAWGRLQGLDRLRQRFGGRYRDRVRVRPVDRNGEGARVGAAGARARTDCESVAGREVAFA